MSVTERYMAVEEIEQYIRGCERRIPVNFEEDILNDLLSLSSSGVDIADYCYVLHPLHGLIVRVITYNDSRKWGLYRKKDIYYQDETPVHYFGSDKVGVTGDEWQTNGETTVMWKAKRHVEDEFVDQDKLLTHVRQIEQ